jgi:prophage antirepressor-like protein
MYNVEIVGQVRLGTKSLNVYSSVDEPIFMAVEVAEALEYSDLNNVSKMLYVLEDDEKLPLPAVRGGQTRKVIFITELGLYNLLAQSRMPVARSWRRVVHEQLIKMRKDKQNDIIQQFEEWSEEMSNIYFDEETGNLMKSVTLSGGDVEQVPV